MISKKRDKTKSMKHTRYQITISKGQDKINGHETYQNISLRKRPEYNPWNMVAGVKTQHKAKGYDRYHNTTVSGNQTKIADTSKESNC